MSCYEGGGGGGGGGGSRRRGDGPPVMPSSCESIDFETALASPNPKLLAQVKVDWTLRVEARPSGNTRVAVVVLDKDVLGTITSPEAMQLVDCLEKGLPYRAQVLEIRSGLCRVRIRYSP